MASYLYSVYAQTLESNTALPSLVATRASRVDFCFAWKPPRLCAPTRVTWIHHWRHPDGGEWLHAARAGKGYLLRLERSADFWLSRDGLEIRGVPFRVLSAELLDHLLINHILPFALVPRGLLVFHASGSCLGEKAALFLGGAGTGKSTLAAILLARGYAPLADDCAVVDGRDEALRVLPSPPTLRLWPEVKKAVLGEARHSSWVSGKHTVRLEATQSFPAATTVLSRIYVLTPDRDSSAAPAIESLLGPQALIELIRHSYRLDFSDHSQLTHQFEKLSDLAESVRVSRLTFVPSVEGMAGAADLVLSDLGR